MANFVDPNIPMDVQELISRTTPNWMSAALPKADMMYGGHSSAGPETMAFVSSAMPNTMMFNNRAAKDSRTKFKQMVPHELEHMLQFNVDNRYYDNNANWDKEVMKMSNMPTRDLLNILKSAGDNPKLHQYLTKKGYTPSPYLGNSRKGWYDMREQFADLSALEQQHNVDLTKDPVVRKEFFQDNPDLIEAYKASTGLRTNRLDAKDLPPMTKQDFKSAPPKKTIVPGSFGWMWDMMKRTMSPQ